MKHYSVMQFIRINHHSKYVNVKTRLISDCLVLNTIANKQILNFADSSKTVSSKL